MFVRVCKCGVSSTTHQTCFHHCQCFARMFKSKHLHNKHSNLLSNNIVIVLQHKGAANAGELRALRGTFGEGRMRAASRNRACDLQYMSTFNELHTLRLILFGALEGLPRIRVSAYAYPHEEQILLGVQSARIAVLCRHVSRTGQCFSVRYAWHSRTYRSCHL